VAEAKVLQAKAEAEAIRNIAEAVKDTNSNPATYMLAVKYVDTLKEMASGKDSKTVYIPYEASSMLGSLGSIKELFKQ
jgi:regulator of protease activity HflC (stomatin/prohibitin superfamily)